MNYEIQKELYYRKRPIAANAQILSSTFYFILYDFISIITRIQAARKTIAKMFVAGKSIASAKIRKLERLIQLKVQVTTITERRIAKLDIAAKTIALNTLRKAEDQDAPMIRFTLFRSSHLANNLKSMTLQCYTQLKIGMRTKDSQRMIGRARFSTREGFLIWRTMALKPNLSIKEGIKSVAVANRDRVNASELSSKYPGKTIQPSNSVRMCQHAWLRISRGLPQSSANIRSAVAIRFLLFSKS